MPADVVEIACDESGAEGENLMGSPHRVFTHASVDLSVDDAEAVVAHLRSLVPTQASELKSEQLLRPTHRSATVWLLSDGGPLLEHARVSLVDKDYFVVGKVVDLLIEELAHEHGVDLYSNRAARQMAWTLHREGPRSFASADWQQLLAAFNSLMRARQRRGAKTTVDEFFSTVDQLRLRATRRAVSEILNSVWSARSHADRFQEMLRDAPELLPALDPLIPTLCVSVRYWAERSGAPVRVIHDRQAVLTTQRQHQLIQSMARPHPDFVAFAPPVTLVEIVQVDSRDDARVQLADLLAGAARMVATNELGSCGDKTLTHLLRPYVDEWSLWSDDRSWSALTGRRGVGR